MKLNLPILASIALAMMPLHAQAQTIGALEDQYGRLIEAELVSHRGPDSEKVRISKADKEFELEISTLSEKSQQYVWDWIKKNPTLDPRVPFAVSASKKKQSGDSYVYDVRIENKNGWGDSKLRVEYIVFAKDSKGETASREGSHTTTGPLPRKESTNFLTKHFDPDLKVVKTGSGTITTSTKSSSDKGPRGAASLAGILVRVFDQSGTLLADWRSPGSFRGNWPSPADAR